MSKIVNKKYFRRTSENIKRKQNNKTIYIFISYTPHRNISCKAIQEYILANVI